MNEKRIILIMLGIVIKLIIISPYSYSYNPNNYAYGDAWGDVYTTNNKGMITTGYGSAYGNTNTQVIISENSYGSVYGKTTTKTYNTPRNGYGNSYGKTTTDYDFVGYGYGNSYGKGTSYDNIVQYNYGSAYGKGSNDLTYVKGGYNYRSDYAKKRIVILKTPCQDRRN